jgi:hypothetical protein
MLRLQVQPLLAVHADQAGPLLQLPGLLAGLLAGPWRRFPPGAAALEAAIAEVEDALMPQLPAIALHLADGLYSEDARLQQLASVDGEPAQWPLWLSLADVEQLFGRLASVANGVPLHHAGLPDDAGLCALLLVLRELLQHAGLDGIELRRAQRAGRSTSPIASR